jgi:hypothetical protein
MQTYAVLREIADAHVMNMVSRCERYAAQGAEIGEPRRVPFPDRLSLDATKRHRTAAPVDVHQSHSALASPMPEHCSTAGIAIIRKLSKAKPTGK